MKENIEEKIPVRFLLFFALFWVFLGWLGLICAWTGFFYPWIFVIYILASISVVFFSLKKLAVPGREFIILSIALIFLVSFFSFFSTPTVFSGRDQGSISEAGIRLSQNHKLEFSTLASAEFFKIYGPGKALNFPGFYYNQQGNLTTQFPLPYIAWLAIFYSFFGLAGLIIANAVLLYLFLLYFYFLARFFLKTKYSLLLLGMAITSFSFIWFLKFTLSENMALPLLFISIFSFLVFFKKPSSFFFYSYLASSFLLFFTRIEGIAFLIAGLVLTSLFPATRNFIKSNLIKKFIIPLAILAVFLIINIFADVYFYKEIAKALFSSISSKNFNIGDTFLLPFSYNLQIYIIYGILPFIILGLAGIIYLILKRKWHELIPFFIVLPSFWYLLDSNISSDHPWMLRRFVFSLLPIFIFYTVILLAQWKEKRENIQENEFPKTTTNKNNYQIKNILKEQKSLIFCLTAAIILFLNLPAFLKYSFFSENKSLLEETGALSEKFSNNDLVLVDRRASGDGWAMLSGPLSFLYGKNAVYFFNSSDLEKINLEKFERIFLVLSNKNVNFYKNGLPGKRAVFFKDYFFETERLDISSQKKFPAALPQKKNIKVSGKIFEIIK